MVTGKRNPYYIGYLAGYRDGVRDAAGGKSTLLIESDITKLPITVMKLSVRAQNCLARANCEFIEDVALLSEHALATMHHLGPKTARLPQLLGSRPVHTQRKRNLILSDEVSSWWTI